MSMVNEDVLWLEPLFFTSNFTMLGTTFDTQMASASSSNLSSASSSMSILTASVSTLASALSKQNHFPLLKWSVRIIGGLLIVIGGIGNTLSALTLSRKKLRAQVTSIYLIALALSDLGRAKSTTITLIIRFVFFRQCFLQRPEFLSGSPPCGSKHASLQQCRLQITYILHLLFHQSLSDIARGSQCATVSRHC